MNIFESPPKKKEINFNNLDLNEIIEQSTPPLGAEFLHPVFKQFGSTLTTSTYDKWVFNDTWKTLSKFIKWKFIALNSLYWLTSYQYSYDKLMYENYKRDLFQWSKINPEFLKTLNLLKEKEKEVGSN